MDAHAPLLGGRAARLAASRVFVPTLCAVLVVASSASALVGRAEATAAPARVSAASEVAVGQRVAAKVYVARSVEPSRAILQERNVRGWLTRDARNVAGGVATFWFLAPSHPGSVMLRAELMRAGKVVWRSEDIRVKVFSIGTTSGGGRPGGGTTSGSPPGGGTAGEGSTSESGTTAGKPTTGATPGSATSGLTTPPASSTIIEQNGSLDVTAVGTNGHLYQFNRDPNTYAWAGYDLTAATGGGDTVTGSPVAIYDPGGGLDVMAVGTNGHLFQFHRDPSTFAWTGYDLTAATGGGDTVTGSPATIIEQNDSLDVLAVGTNGHLYQFNRDPNTYAWTAWDLTSASGGGDTVTAGGGGIGGSGSPPETEQAIAWAQQYLGSSYDDGYCLEFVQSAYSTAGIAIGSADTAADYWSTDPEGYAEHPGDTNPPIGALVFWGPDDVDGYSNPAGHVGIYVGAVAGYGTDEVISTWSWPEPSSQPDVHYFSLSGRNAAGYPYLGWLAP
jgi:hypothetical protein